MKPILPILTIACAAFAQTAHAGARAELTAFTQGLRSLQGGFVQTVTDAKGRVKERSSGRVTLAAPNQLRWEYVTPHAQLVVADGRTVWVYEPELRQASRRAQGGEDASNPLSALLAPATLERSFAVSELPAANDGLAWLRLVPKIKAQSAFDSALLGFRAGQLAQVVVNDALGTRTQMSFGTWQRNARVSAATFTFKPPQGVDVIGN